jgi:OOP family OmpA-OmpF porin
MEREQTALARLQEKVDDPQQFAEAVSSVLAEAFALSEARSEKLSKTLAPTFERAAQESIRKDPGTLVGILYPLMGPAIRKAIAESLDGTLQKLNQAFKHSFSWRGLKWRLEAFRTGSSFADVVLNHTVEFRVEHVFLIHKKTGLLLEHVATPEAEGQDPQLVSGMLTAIQDFVRDSFSGNSRKQEGDGAGIDSLRLGDLLLWCEEGPFAFLAAVIRGNPPDALRTALRETLTKIHEDLRIPLEEFQGDAASLTNLNSSLGTCLQRREQPEEKRLSPWLKWLPVAFLLIVGLWIAWRALDARRIDGYVQRLRNEPGIVVTGIERRGWFWPVWHISGLRDPLATDPEEILIQAHLNPARVDAHWESYEALSPAMVLKRLTATLDTPRDLSFTLDGNVIRAHGSAPQQWVDRARSLMKAMPTGSAQVDLTAVADVQDPTFVRLRDSIQALVIKFHPNAPRPAPGQ